MEERTKERHDLTENMRSNGPSSGTIEDFLVLMAVCHTVIPERGDDGEIASYNAASPDEKALVEGAKMYGYEFVNRLVQIALDLE